MLALNKQSNKLKDWSVEMPNAPYSNRYSALEEWESRIILLTLRYENKNTAYKSINSTLH